MMLCTTQENQSFGVKAGFSAGGAEGEGSAGFSAGAAVAEGKGSTGFSAGAAVVEGEGSTGFSAGAAAAEGKGSQLHLLLQKAKVPPASQQELLL